MDNALVPWFILVPVTEVKEIYLLEEPQQHVLLENINIVSQHIQSHYPVTKLNIGAIGNIVSQLHIHIVGRSSSDFAWPDVVWGNSSKVPYTKEQVESILNRFIYDCNASSFTSNENIFSR